ncbi:hypothetical protein O181_059463 [Austropuccinia psidii MF-1]|uniref:Uncharacterized protein n=1 Tax=Austropuccinia psidii MF-1 TaxID=1389203 RepID=A0A9Q3EIU8_9BASI|nr:hypothetical protein [Austropuccinia psidii MF-1]
MLGRSNVIVLDHWLPMSADIYEVRNMDLFGKEFQVSEAPTPDGTYRDVLDGEEVEVIHNSISHQFSTSPSHPHARRFQSNLILSTPNTIQPTLDTVPTSLPPPSPTSFTTRLALIPEVRPSPIVTSQQLQPVAGSSRRIEELSPFLFPVASVFQLTKHWPIQVTREDPNTASKNQDSVARVFRRVDRNSGELIEHATDRNIPGTASEEMTAKFARYEDELINDFQRTFDNLG